uniref:Cytochrome P450 n=1 Tax=Setaria digitata TaxID=48799 RepID=A0A915PF15_9BILA
MLVLFLLVVLFVFIAKYGKQIKHKAAEKWRFIRLASKLPGPTLWEMLEELSQFTLDREKFTYCLEAIFRKYAYKDDHGMVSLWFGLTPTLLLTRTKSAKVIFENSTLVNKTDDYEASKRLTGNGMLSASGEKWFRARRMLTPAFHFNILRKYMEIFNEQAKILLEKLDMHSDTNQTFDLLPYLRRFGLDVIAEATMGVRVDAQNYHRNDQFAEALQIMQHLAWVRILYPWFWFAPIRWLFGFNRKLDYYCNICKNLIHEVIAEKKKEWEAFDNQPSTDDLTASGKKQLSFLDLLFSIRNQYNLTDEDIRDQVATIMAAGEQH